MTIEQALRRCELTSDGERAGGLLRDEGLNQATHSVLVVDDRIPADLPVVVEQERRAEGQKWLAVLPALLDAAADRWDLRIGPPFVGGSAAWAGPVLRADGSEAVLKVTLPHREARYEGEGLRIWDGDGAVQIYEEDAPTYSLLIERCRPGTDLKFDPGAAEDRLATASHLLSGLWEQPIPDGAPFETVAEVCGEWAQLVRRRMDQVALPIDMGLVVTGADLLESLPASATRRVLASIGIGDRARSRRRASPRGTTSTLRTSRIDRRRTR